MVHTHRVCLGECSLAQIPSLTHTALSALIYHDPMSPFFSITNAYDHISIVCDVETRHSTLRDFFFFMLKSDATPTENTTFPLVFQVYGRWASTMWSHGHLENGESLR